MTAGVAPFPDGFPGRVPTRIVNERRVVDRVVDDATSKPPETSLVV